MSARVSKGCGWDGMDVVWALLIMNASWIKGGREGGKRARADWAQCRRRHRLGRPSRSGDQGPDIE